ncbi:MAG TPA: hypothetical protein PLX97_02395, partial [Gemmatales bacterium]|nr:hypothetical protein [Gemmatales bacterium]
MMHTFMLMVTALLMVGHSAGSKTRIGEEMLIDQAFKQADVVVIAFANAHRDAKPGEMKPPQDVEKYLAGVITTFEIMQVVKGNEPRKTIELVHFKFAINGQRLAHSPPSLVRFKIRPK